MSDERRDDEILGRALGRAIETIEVNETPFAQARIATMGERRGVVTSRLVGAMADLRGVGVDIVTMGQYLAPSEHNHPVRRYYTPEEFAELGRRALEMGFRHVESAPLVRSSYMAHRAVQSPAQDAARDLRR